MSDSNKNNGIGSTSFRDSAFHPLLVASLAGLLSSCMLFKPQNQSAKTSKHRKRAPLCELKPGVERFVFMSYGKYAARSPSGLGRLELHRDQTYFLSFTNNVSHVEVQHRGRFEWKKQGVFEVLERCGERHATEHYVHQGTSDTSTAVLDINHDPDHFKVNWGQLGEITFTKK